MSSPYVLDAIFRGIPTTEFSSALVEPGTAIGNALPPDFLGTSTGPISPPNPMSRGIEDPHATGPPLFIDDSDALASDENHAGTHQRKEDSNQEVSIPLQYESYLPEDLFCSQVRVEDEIPGPNAENDPLADTNFYVDRNIMGQQEPVETIDNISPTSTTGIQNNHTSNEAGAVNSVQLERHPVENPARTSNDSVVEALRPDTSFQRNISTSATVVNIGTQRDSHASSDTHEQKGPPTSLLDDIPSSLSEFLLLRARVHSYAMVEADTMHIAQKLAVDIHRVMESLTPVFTTTKGVDNTSNKRKDSDEASGQLDMPAPKRTRRTSEETIAGCPFTRDGNGPSVNRLQGSVHLEPAKRPSSKSIGDGSGTIAPHSTLTATRLDSEFADIANEGLVPETSMGHDLQEMSGHRNEIMRQCQMDGEEKSLENAARLELSAVMTAPSALGIVRKEYLPTNDEIEPGVAIAGPSQQRPQEQQPQNRRRPRQRFSKNAKASTYCHICGRSAKSSPIYRCANVPIGLCRKVLCEKCIIVYKAGPLEVAKKEDSGWLCTHCNGLCPKRARCTQYNTNNEKRREKNQAERRRKRELEEKDGRGAKRRRQYDQEDGDENLRNSATDGAVH